MKTSLHRGLLLAGLTLAMALGAGSSQAQTWTAGGTANGNGSYNWNDSLNWNSGTPVSSSSTAIVFTGTTGTNTVQNISDPFTLNSLTLDFADSASSFAVSGGKLVFDGTGANISMSDYRSTTPANNALRIDSAIQFNAATALSLTTSAGVNPPGYELVLNGTLSGTGPVTASHTSSTAGPQAYDLLLGGRNATMTGGFTISDASDGMALYLGNVNALGRGVALNSGTGLSGVALGSFANAFAGVTVERGYNQQLGNLTGAGALSVGSFSTGFTAQQSATLAVGFANVDATYAGVIRYATAASHLAKVGTGALISTASMGSGTTVIGDLSVRDGLYQVSGSGTFGSTASSPTGAITLTVYGGAEFRSVTGTSSGGRLQNNAAINLLGGTLRLDATGFNTAGGYSDPTGALSIGVGQSTIRIDNRTTATINGARFTFTSLANATTGTLFFQANNLGTVGSTTSGSNTGNVAITAALTSAQFVGGTATYGAAATNLKIIPFAFAATSNTGLPETFVTYDSTITSAGSVRRLESSNYAPAFGVATDNVSLTADASVSGTANSLRIAANLLTVTLAGNTNLTSGALLISNIDVVTGSGVLAFGSASGDSTAYVTTVSNATIQGPTLLAANFSKNGPGGLTLNTAGNSYTLTATNPVFAVNAGSLTLNSGSVVTSTALAANNVLTYQIAKGATFNAVSGLAIDNFKVLQGSGTVTGAVTISGSTGLGGNTGTIRPSALGGPDASLASPGTLTLTGATTTFGTGGTYEYYVSSVIGAQSDVAGNAYLRSLVNADTINVTATSANPFRIKVTGLQLSNALLGSNPVYDADGGNYSWIIAHTTGGVTNFSADKFAVDYNAAQFPGANLSVSLVGNDVVLTLAPAVVPEPTTILGVAAVGLGVLHRVRRKRKARLLTEKQRI